MKNPEQAGPVDPKYVETMNNLGRFIDSMLNAETMPKKEIGFALLLFKFGESTDEDRVNIAYISNAQRGDMLKALKEFIARAEGTYKAT